MLEMKNNFKILLFIAFFIVSIPEIMAQNIPSKNKKIDSEVGIPSSTGELKVDFSKTKNTMVL